MGSNADGNSAVKCKRDEQCCLVTLLTDCCSCMDCKVCSLLLEMDQNRSLWCLMLYSLIHYAHCRHSLVLLCGDGVGMDAVFTGTGGNADQFLSPCRPLSQFVTWSTSCCYCWCISGVLASTWLRRQDISQHHCSPRLLCLVVRRNGKHPAIIWTHSCTRWESRICKFKSVVTCKIKHLQNICKNVSVFHFTCNHL